jgi:cell division protein FtsX
VVQVVTNEDMLNAFHRQLPAKCLTKKKKVQLAENGLPKMMQIVVEENQQVKERNQLMSALTQNEVEKKVEQAKDHERRVEQRLQKENRL